MLAFLLHISSTSACLVALILIYRYLKWRLSPLQKITGPKNRGSIWGNFLEIQREPFLAPHKRWWKEVGTDARAIHYTIMFWRSSVLILDKDVLRVLLTAPYGKQVNRFTKITRMLSDVLGDGLVTLEGPDWMRHRRMIQPAFNTQFLRESMNEAVPSKVNRLVTCWEQAGEHREIDLNSHFSALTLDVIGDVAFSHDFGAMNHVREWSDTKQDESEEEEDKKKDQLTSINDPFVVHLTKALGFNLISVALFLLGLTFFNRFINPTSRKQRFLLDEAVDKVVSDAKKENTKRKSLLHLMLQARDDSNSETAKEENGSGSSSSLSDAELRDEVKTFIIAGHETTSIWLYWALFALSKYPDVQELVYKDIVKHAPAASVPEITVEHVEKMEYMNAFLQETLRMYPPIGFFTRVNSFEENFNGMVIPAGTRLTVSPHLMHRHPLYWDAPEEFRPERFLNVPEAEEERRRFAFFPFSTGGRNCIGQLFAKMEAQLILAPIVRAFRVTTANSQRDTEFTFTSTVTMKTKPRFRISVKKR